MSYLDPEEQNKNLDNRILAALERISQVMRSNSWPESSRHKLSPLQYQVLWFIGTHNAKLCSVTQLSKEFNVTKPTMSDSLRVLTEKGLLNKIQDLADKRKSTFELTDKGKSVLGDSQGFGTELKKPLQQMSRDNKDMLYRSLSTLVFRFYEDGLLQSQRMCQTCKWYGIGNSADNFRCNLLEKFLSIRQRRLDCPEHEAF